MTHGAYQLDISRIWSVLVGGAFVVTGCTGCCCLFKRKHAQLREGLSLPLFPPLVILEATCSVLERAYFVTDWQITQSNNKVSLTLRVTADNLSESRPPGVSNHTITMRRRHKASSPVLESTLAIIEIIGGSRGRWYTSHHRSTPPALPGTNCPLPLPGTPLVLHTKYWHL